MPSPDFDAFRRQALDDCADDAFAEDREPETIAATQTHPFTAKETLPT